MGSPELPNVCQGCLSDDRKCNIIEGNNLNAFLRILHPDGNYKAASQDIKCLFLCWECNATLRKIKAFQMKVQKASNLLKNHYLPNLKHPCLSTLKTFTKNKYDAEIDKSINLNEITTLKIEADQRAIGDNLLKKDDKKNISQNNVFKFEVDVYQCENSDLSDNDHDSTDQLSDEKPILDLKSVTKNGLKVDCTNNIKLEDTGDLASSNDPLAGRPKRITKPVNKLKIAHKKYEPKTKSRAKTKKQVSTSKGKEKVSPALPESKVLKPDNVSEPTLSNDKKKRPTEAPPDSEDDDGPNKEDVQDPNSTHKKKRKFYPRVRFFRCSRELIDRNNLLQYFTKYQLSEAEYRDFLEKLSKTPYFTNNYSKCTKCVVTFFKEQDHLQHMKLHKSSTGTFSCNICDLYFLEKQQHQDHMEAHLTVYQCNICKQTLGLQHSISNHMKTVHSKRSIFKCARCPLLFESRVAARLHFDKLHKRLVCNECGLIRHTKDNMILHFQLSHLKPECPHCHRKFKKYAYLQSHLILKHRYPEKEQWKMEDMYCVECDKQFTNMQSYRIHAKIVHGPNKAAIKMECKECGKLMTKTHLKKHYDLYHGVPKFRCNICNKPFAKSDSMRRHTDVVHLGMRPAKNKPCYICGRLFTGKSTLVNHIRTHTGERPYECSHCPASFAQKTARDMHVRKQHLKHLENFDSYPQFSDREST